MNTARLAERPFSSFAKVSRTLRIMTESEFSPGPSVPETLVLVPNRTYQQLAFVEQLSSSGPTDPPPAPLRAPAIEVLSLWAARLFTRAAMMRGNDCPHVPGRLRLKRLWEDAIIATDQQGLFQADISALAKEAMEADRLCEHWLLPAGKAPGKDWYDEGFCRWRERVHASLAAHDWLDAPGLLRRLARLLEDAGDFPVALPPEVHLRGFVEITPLERRLLDGLTARGVRVHVAEPSPGRQVQCRAELFPTGEEELWAAAGWAERQLETGAQRVAVLVNDFRALRPALERVFQQTFTPAAALLTAEEAHPPYFLHGGAPLADHPLMRDAFDLLEISLRGPRSPQPFDRISRWLLSGAWEAATAEGAERALLELALREAGRFEPSLAFSAEQAQRFELPVLVERVARLPGRESAATAATMFHRWLTHWGWPGPGAGGNRVRQVIDGLRTALEALEFSGVRSPEQGLRELRQLCLEQLLPSPGGVLASVQVMPVEDAVSRQFDSVRLVNVHGDNWPGPVRLNRLLPYQLARHLPRSDMRRQLEHARSVQAGALSQVATAVFSRAEMIDGVETAPSPLLEATTQKERQATTIVKDLARVCWPGAGEPAMSTQRDRLETVPRKAGPALAPELQQVKGVVSLLNLQSACPWAAFLVHRLAARFPPQPSPFADLLFTGNLVHQALEQLYRGYLGQAAGQGSVPGATDVPAVVEQVLARPGVNFRLAPAALAAERTRLIALLTEWLDTEASLPLGRPVALEERREATLAGFRFTVRMDRLDALEDGGLVLDYKTGILPTITWGEAHPTELQMPLYAVLARQSEAPVVGIGLLSIRPGEMKQLIWSGSDALKGRSVQRVGQGKKSPFASWDEALDTWESTIVRLLEDYRAGQADFVVHQENALKWAGLDLLLRRDRTPPAAASVKVR